MHKYTTSAALERLEGVAAEFLEHKIAEVQRDQQVEIKEVEVAVIPGGRGDAPAVTVVVRTS